jgi:hypothetical protein
MNRKDAEECIKHFQRFDNAKLSNLFVRIMCKTKFFTQKSVIQASLRLCDLAVNISG